MNHDNVPWACVRGQFTTLPGPRRTPHASSRPPLHPTTAPSRQYNNYTLKQNQTSSYTTFIFNDSVKRTFPIKY